MEPILAADTATTTTIVGAAVAITVAVIGFFGTRKSRPEAMSVLIDSAVKLAQVAGDDNDDLRIVVAGLRAEVENLRAAIAECERKHSRAQAAMAQAGIVIIDD